MNISAEQEIAGIMAAAVGRLQKRPAALAPDHGTTTADGRESDARAPAVGQDDRRQEQPQPQENPT